jgi:hypothetical protein
LGLGERARSQSGLGGAGGGGRTLTTCKGHGILSPARLPVSPLRLEEERLRAEHECSIHSKSRVLVDRNGAVRNPHRHVHRGLRSRWWKTAAGVLRHERAAGDGSPAFDGLPVPLNQPVEPRRRLGPFAGAHRVLSANSDARPLSSCIDRDVSPKAPRCRDERAVTRLPDEPGPG